MKTNVLLVRSAPGSPEARSALRLARSLHESRTPVALALIECGTLCALPESRLSSAAVTRDLVASGVPCQVLADDLAMRGFYPEDTVPGCQPITYEDLVDALLSGEASVSGAF